MLPCWSAYDSLDSWKRVLEFHSELSVNRNWFWLVGFPLFEKYGGKYEESDLANAENVRSLIRFCRARWIKFFIGGGWHSWHLKPGADYYRDMLALLPETEGIYLEPSGEGKDERSARKWKKHAAELKRTVSEISRDRPDFEFAVAVGRFNSRAYRNVLGSIDRKRLFYWWCWGHPIEDNVLDEYPLVLGWHVLRTNIRPANKYRKGFQDSPDATLAKLSGFATSYDPGIGYGNQWNAWGKMGVDHPRDVHPHTIPYFSHQYFFRERCWNLHITKDQFAARISRRLFDVDMPPESIRHYLSLPPMCPDPKAADEAELAAIDAFVRSHAETGTPRNRDTLARMREAVKGLRSIRHKSQRGGAHEQQRKNG